MRINWRSVPTCTQATSGQWSNLWPENTLQHTDLPGYVYEPFVVNTTRVKLHTSSLTVSFWDPTTPIFFGVRHTLLLVDWPHETSRTSLYRPQFATTAPVFTAVVAVLAGFTFSAPKIRRVGDIYNRTTCKWDEERSLHMSTQVLLIWKGIFLQWKYMRVATIVWAVLCSILQRRLCVCKNGT